MQEAKEAPAACSRNRGGFLSDRIDDLDRGGPRDFDLPPWISSSGVWEASIVAWFWNAYGHTTAPSDASKSTSVWLYRTVELPNPIPVLHQALLALSVTRCGRVHCDEAMMKHGQATYGRALRLLQQALYDEVLMLHDETLASVRALVLYEVRAIRSLLGQQQTDASAVLRIDIK